MISLLDARAGQLAILCHRIRLAQTVWVTNMSPKHLPVGVDIKTT